MSFTPNEHVCAKVANIKIVASLSETFSSNSLTELDSHANMAVIGINSEIIADTGKTANVKAFSLDCATLDSVRIVDAALKWI